ncbi:MAG: hypothetical protein DHS20C21_07640 [Gemmatimonadota bacterium]|nr:MAG: hypothetical protein DHS20C21_07640 [Gemmatimonadota bacterium]
MYRPRLTSSGSVLASVVALSLLTGCNNILEWGVNEESFDVLMARGRAAIQEAEYAVAEEKFTQAVELRPNSADARYHFAKATVLNAEVDVFSLVQTLTADRPEGSSSAGSGASGIFNHEASVANSIYRVNRQVLDALEPIRHRETEGPFSDANVDLDLAVAYTLRGILRLRDTNGDGVIDASDLSPNDFQLGDEGDFSLDGIDNLPPEDLNNMIGDLNLLLDEGGDLLIDALDDSGLDVDELGDLIESLGGDLSAFYVNTGIPGNPGEGDNDGDGLTDEECMNGIDDDGDGTVDEDSRLSGC